MLSLATDSPTRRGSMLSLAMSMDSPTRKNSVMSMTDPTSKRGMNNCPKDMYYALNIYIVLTRWLFAASVSRPQEVAPSQPGDTSVQTKASIAADPKRISTPSDVTLDMALSRQSSRQVSNNAPGIGNITDGLPGTEMSVGLTQESIASADSNLLVDGDNMEKTSQDEQQLSQEQAEDLSWYLPSLKMIAPDQPLVRKLCTPTLIPIQMPIPAGVNADKRVGKVTYTSLLGPKSFWFESRTHLIAEFARKDEEERIRLASLPPAPVVLIPGMKQRRYRHAMSRDQRKKAFLDQVKENRSLI